jgi:hypothetical protein
LERGAALGALEEPARAASGPAAAPGASTLGAALSVVDPLARGEGSALGAHAPREIPIIASAQRTRAISHTTRAETTAAALAPISSTLRS